MRDVKWSDLYEITVPGDAQFDRSPKFNVASLPVQYAHRPQQSAHRVPVGERVLPPRECRVGHVERDFVLTGANRPRDVPLVGRVNPRAKSFPVDGELRNLLYPSGIQSNGGSTGCAQLQCCPIAK